MKWCVYMMVADAGEGFSFCKVGITGNLSERIVAVQVGCPVPIREVAYLSLRAEQTRLAERVFHDWLKDYHSQGEWFRMNLADPIHKAVFHDATRKVIELVGLSETRWKRMDLRSIKMLDKVLRLDKAA
jgi:hypothetical protein